MSLFTDAQNTAINNAAGIVVTTGQAGTGGTETVVSGTAFQVAANRMATLYIEVTTAAALGITMGATSTGNTFTIATSESEALGVTTLRVPAGWYVVLTGTIADFVVTAILD